ncbi:MAG: hypothetical protein AB7G11_02605 [Phycisphaerales bacterium]
MSQEPSVQYRDPNREHLPSDDPNHPAQWVGYCVRWARRHEEDTPRFDWEQAALWALWRAHVTFVPGRATFIHWLGHQLKSAEKTMYLVYHRRQSREVCRPVSVLDAFPTPRSSEPLDEVLFREGLSRFDLPELDIAEANRKAMLTLARKQARADEVNRRRRLTRKYLHEAREKAHGLQG